MKLSVPVDTYNPNPGGEEEGSQSSRIFAAKDLQGHPKMTVTLPPKGNWRLTLIMSEPFRKLEGWRDSNVKCADFAKVTSSVPSTHITELTTVYNTHLTSYSDLCGH